MNVFSRTLSAIILAILCVSSTALFAEAADVAPTPVPTAAAALPDPVAMVNGLPVAAIDLMRARKVLLGGQSASSLNPKQIRELDHKALNQLVSAELLYQAALKLEVKDLERKVDEKLAQGRARFTREQDFLNAIKNLDMTEKDLREYTRRDLIISSFVESTIVPGVQVTDQAARSFYDQNPEKFRRDEAVRASHILIGVDAKATDAEKKASREKIEKLRKELAAGADFAALAKANSTCPSSQQGGDLGFFGKGQMVPSFEKAAFGLKPGEVSAVVETQFGYHLIKLAEKKAAEAVAFDEAKPRIIEFLKGQKINGAVADFLTEARKTAKIEILLK